MGIPYYFYKLSQKYNNIVSNKKPENTDIYCIDFNGIIHNVAQELIYEKDIVNVEDKIIEGVWNKILHYIDVYKAKKYIICADGVAPAAKMSQQRKRRYLSIYRNIIDDAHITKKPQWDTNAITPGTQFMNNLNVFISKKIRYSTFSIDIIYSGSNETGEGEHKIFKKLKIENDYNNIIINGLDADLIILSLISHKKKIYLMRETKDRDTGDIIFNYLNIDNLKNAILCEVKEKWNMEISYESYNDIDIIETYCTMTSILGNDFIPHLLTIELKTDGIDKLISATKISIEQHGLLIYNGKINYNTLKSIFKYLSTTEDKDIHYVCEKYINKRIMGDAKLPSDCYALKNKDNLSYYIYNNPGNWHKEYYKQIFNTNITLDSTDMFNACNNYIKGIYWVYSYYKGADIDCEWFYPYNYPPTLKDLTNHSIAYEEPIINSNNNFVSPNMQLLIVLPKESSHLLKPKYKKYMDDIYMGLFHMYPKKYKIQTFLKTHLWECCPILPLINLNHINRILELNTVT
tara:strand:+ start:3632 stop:5185 length:1554 start_codon:yes stop_codon:yes gene_type:complete